MKYRSTNAAAPQDPLSIPVDRSKRLSRTSYKNPARVRVIYELRGAEGRVVDGWTLWFIVGDAVFPLVKFDQRRWRGGGAVFGRNAEGGVNLRLAEVSGLNVDLAYEKIRDAEHFGLFAVSPDETSRTQVAWNLNDRVDDEVPGQLPRGHGRDTRNSKVPGQFMDHPPEPEFFFGEQPVEPPDPPAPPPPQSNEPDVEPGPEDIRVPDAFKRWMEYPETLDLGGPIRITVSRDEIKGEWSRDLGYLPRFEGPPDKPDRGRFARLVWVLWVGDEYVGAHGEHMRDGEEQGAAIHPWTKDGMDLGETLAAKSKDDAIEEIGIDVSKIRRLGLMVVTHDKNPNPQRSPWYWWGEPFTGSDDEPEPPPPPPTDPPDEDIDVPRIRRLLTEALEMLPSG